MEILQGSFKCYFSGQKFYQLQHKEKSHAAAAAQIYFDCRRSGITIRSSVDCLIAQCLHNDKDFKQIAKVITGFKHKCFMQ